VWGECVSDALESKSAGFWVSSVEGADAHGEGQIERVLVGQELEVLDGDLADAQAAGVDLDGCILLG
jgi:hypothetical protein